MGKSSTSFRAVGDPRVPGPGGGSAEGNEARAFVHGGEAAIKRLHDGGKLPDVALDLQKQVHADIEVHGYVHALREMAERHVAVANLFYGLVLGAGSIERADEFCKRFGWLSSSGFRMLAEVARMEKERRSGMADYDQAVEELDK